MIVNCNLFIVQWFILDKKYIKITSHLETEWVVSASCVFERSGGNI